MNNYSKLRVSSCLVGGFVGLMGLSACSVLPSYNDENTQVASSAPNGRYKQVEQGGALSPEEQHARARAQVEPTKMVQHNAYVKTVEQVKAEQNSHTRVVKMEQDLGAVKKEFKGLKDLFKRADALPTPSAIAPASGTSLVHVSGIRTGEHPGKTRLVLDMDGRADFKYELDNQKNILVISLPSAQWTAAKEQVFKNSKIIQAYAAKPSKTGGALVALKLKGPAKVLFSQKLGKNAAGKYRIFLDVAPL